MVLHQNIFQSCFGGMYLAGTYDLPAVWNFTYPGRMEDNGDRRFGVAAPSVWNSLPLELKAASPLISFKQKFKTYLFLQAYGPNE